MIDTNALMLQIIKRNSPDLGWVQSKFESFKNLGGTNKGEIGEDFISQYLRLLGFKFERAGIRSDEYDGLVEGQPYEVKTASLGSAGTFQFNHVRVDHGYKILICLGVEPERIVFGAWTKQEIFQELERAVGMARGQTTTRKLTKRSRDLLPIERLQLRIVDLLATLRSKQQSP